MVRRVEVRADLPAMPRYTAHAAKDPITAILKQLAPIAVIPPSPKKMAWIVKAIEIASMEAQGPSTTAANPTPTACPVVPTGSGKLNIMMTKENAATSETRGTRRVWSAFRTRSRATYQKGAEPAYNAAHVAGLRYPSGICI